MAMVLSNLIRFKKFFHWKIPSKFAVKWIPKYPPHLAYVATLPCKTLVSAKHPINDKLQGGVESERTNSTADA